MKNQIILNKVEFWTDARGILFCEFGNSNKFRKLDIDVANQYENAIASLTQGKPMPFLIDIRNTRGSFTSKAARLFAQSKVFNKARICEAFVVNSINTELLINSYKRIYEPTTPFLIFDNVESAIDYCLEAKKRFNANN